MVFQFYNRKSILLLICLLLVFQTIYSQDFNRPTPQGFPPYEFEILNSGLDRFMFLAPFNNTSSSNFDPNLGILDKNGYLAWNKPSSNSTLFDFKVLDNGLISFAQGNLSGANTTFQILNQQLELIDSITLTAPFRIDIHELISLKNGNYLVGAIYDSTMDLSSYLFNGTPGDTNAVVTGFVLFEIDNSGNIVFSWDAFDYIPFMEYYTSYGYNPNGLRYCQGNAIEEDFDGNILVSFRVLNAIYKINRSNGNVIWRLNGKSNDFVFQNDAGFSAQHDIRRLVDGSITLFDNGNMSIKKISRVVNYTLDTIGFTVTKNWEYTYNDSIYASAMGNFQTVSNNLKLINWGNLKRPSPSITLIDDSDNTVANLYFVDEYINYRAFLFDESNLNIQRPTINCYKDSGKFYLESNDEFDKYEWSTGANTKRIEVDTAGVYQLWVNYGIGKAGSLPIFLTDLIMDCSTLSVKEHKYKGDRELVAIYNELGQPIQVKRAGKFYIEVYSDGTRKKIIHIP